MRLVLTIAALTGLTCAAPLNVRADDGPDTPQTTAEEQEAPLSGLKSQLPDRGQLQSLLGSLIRHIGERQGGDSAPAGDVDSPPPPPPIGGRFDEDDDLLPPPPPPPRLNDVEAPAAPIQADRHSRRSFRSRSPFSERLLSRRMALIERIRADAIARGDTDMAARSEQLGAFVVELHEVGLAGMAQRLGELGAIGGGSSTAGPDVEFPDTDFGEASALPGTDLGAPADLRAPENIPSELPLELPPPAVPE